MFALSLVACGGRGAPTVDRAIAPEPVQITRSEAAKTTASATDTGATAVGPSLELGRSAVITPPEGVEAEPASGTSGESRAASATDGDDASTPSPPRPATRARSASTAATRPLATELVDDGPRPARGVRRGDRFLTHEDRPIVAALATEEIASVERGRGGRSLGFRVTLADGTRAYFKPDQTFNGMSWNAEIVAHHLDRELGLGRVAPVVSRTFAWSELEAAAGSDGRVDEIRVDDDGQVRGALIWWVPERVVPVALPDGWERWLRIEGDPPAVTPFQRPGEYRRARARARAADAPATPAAPQNAEPDRPERPAEMSDLIVFDYLTQNLDRWGTHNTNVRTVGEGGPLMYLDNAAAFTLRSPRIGLMDLRLHQVQRFRRSTIDAVRALDVDAFRDRLAEDPNGPLLDDRHLTNLATRRQHLLAYVDGLIEEHGEDAVFFAGS